ncbi:hypothetical protein H632_c3063p0 [Helicosporidium sp. ATCC 50920]|nr:hypothetical protein H632_c3063p0 [Helicosporidium sp. ATCC 50920]|eukprot:KDD72658.1 hypothetical protein H632_c3063p0 [Helicosporidium sp. ATCC 50920]
MQARRQVESIRAGVQAEASDVVRQLEARLVERTAKCERRERSSRAQIEALSKKNRDFEAAVQRLQDKLKALERRRRVDVEGWVSDVSALRRRLAAADGAMRLAHAAHAIADVDHRDRVIARHRGRPEAGMLRPSSVAPEELRTARKQLDVLGARLQAYIERELGENATLNA